MGLSSFLSRFLLALTLSISLVSLANAQQSLIAPIVGTVSGLVEADDGSMVEPRGAVSGTITASIENGNITASIAGTASCTEGLGLHFTFAGEFDGATGNFSARYTDIPGAEPDTDAQIEFLGDAAWQISLQGDAPANNGTRAYDIKFVFEVPGLAVYEGFEIPLDTRYGGTLDQTLSIPISFDEAATGISVSESLELSLDGRWDATAIPKVDGTFDFTGQASGRIRSDLVSLSVESFFPEEVSVPISHTVSIDVEFKDDRISLDETQSVEFVFTGTFNGVHTGSGVYRGSASGTFTTSTYTLSNNAAIPTVTLSITRTESVTVPVVNEDLGLDTSVTLDLTVNGTGSLASSTNGLTGSASGSFETSEVSVDGVSEASGGTIDIQLTGAFGGSLFLESQTEVAFRGSWVAEALNQEFGGDIKISIPLTDVSSFPYTITGSFPVETGFDSLPRINVPLNFSGSFPLQIE